MAWYVAADGERSGPWTDEQFEGVRSAGHIRADTWIWRSGFDRWRRYGEWMAATEGEGPAQCVSCLRAGPPDRFVEVAGAMLCGACKPAYLQRLLEGVRVPSRQRLAGFWVRAAAKVVDGVLLTPVNLTVIWMVSSPWGGEPSLTAAAFQLAGSLIIVMILVGYNSVCVGIWGATPGKRLLGVRVVTGDGKRVTFTRAFTRAAGELLSGCLVYVGYLLAAFDDQKRTLHDILADTRVVTTEIH